MKDPHRFPPSSCRSPCRYPCPLPPPLLPSPLLQHIQRYEQLVNGSELVESTLKPVLPEFLNAELALRTIGDVSQAIDWLRSTYLYVRIQRAPGQYGVPHQLEPGGDALDRWLKERLVLTTVRELAEHGMVGWVGLGWLGGVGGGRRWHWRAGGQDSQGGRPRLPTPALFAAGCRHVRNSGPLPALPAYLPAPPSAAPAPALLPFSLPPRNPPAGAPARRRLWAGAAAGGADHG